jgi:hypothetical protein
MNIRLLISQKVRQEVRAYNERRSRNFGREYRTPSDLAVAALSGEVNVNRNRVFVPVDEEREMKVALEAFSQGLYQVYVGDHRLDSLDSDIELEKDTRVTFLRMVPLRGGKSPDA